MNFTRELRLQILDPALSTDERALRRCRLAKHLEEIGDYESAREALDTLWPVVGQHPNLEGLDQRAAAEVLLRVGTLTGWIGSARQIEGAQGVAKDLITQSIAIFKSLHEIKRVAEAQTEIAVCYRREGALDEARVWFAEALSRLSDEDGDLKAVALLRSSVLEQLAHRLSDALYILKSATPLFEASTNHTLKGRFHNEFAMVLKNLGAAENRLDYTDQALIEFTAASFHFEQAGHDRYHGCVENNLAMLFFKAQKFEEAHEHLDRAQALFTTLDDVVHLAQVNETRARVFLAERIYVKAEEMARFAVRLLERGDQHSLLAEALTTQGVALSRLQHQGQARALFERAIQVAEQADDRESAGLAALTLVEEISESLSEDEQYSILKRADDRLANTQNAELLHRQKNCFQRFATRTFWPDLTTFSLEDAVHRYEARHVLRVLEETGGVIRQAARLLQLTPQGLHKILNTRHKNLRPTIAAIKARKFETSFKDDEDLTGSEVHTVRVLHVEDHETISGMVKEMFEIEGWEVDTCSDGNEALQKISSDALYDLLLIDYDVPGINGLELIHRARNIPHHSQTPIVMLSATPVEAAAREAGADVFLQKPQDIGSFVETISRLLGEREQG